MLDRLRNLDVERLDVDEMVALSLFARDLAEEYKTLGLDAPEWLDVRSTEVRREISTRRADLRDKRIRELRASLSALKTKEERKVELHAELERLEAAAKAV